MQERIPKVVDFVEDTAARTAEDTEQAIQAYARLYSMVPTEVLEHELSDAEDEVILRQLNEDWMRTVRQLKEDRLMGWGFGGC
jgi:hypothetical protein